MTISRQILLRMRNVLDKILEKIKTHFMFNNFFRKSCLWDVEKYDGAGGATNDVKIWRIILACWINKATCTYAHAQTHAIWRARAHTHTHTQICNVYCFSTATIIRERASVLRYMYNETLYGSQTWPWRSHFSSFGEFTCISSGFTQ